MDLIIKGKPKPLATAVIAPATTAIRNFHFKGLSRLKYGRKRFIESRASIASHTMNCNPRFLPHAFTLPKGMIQLPSYIPDTLKHLYMIILPLVALCFQSCAFRPAVDDQGNIRVSKPNKLMRHHGIREFNQLKQTKTISTDPRYTRPVARVATRLQKVIHLPGAKWEFVVFKDNSPNAFALPGGKVGVNTGLFHILGNGKNRDALLAAVLGHEISHVTANHAEHRMYRGIGLAVLGSLLWYSLDHNDVDHPHYSVAAFTAACYFVDSLPFSRKQEYESDRIGAIYMAKAGYDPRESIELWRRLRSYHTHHGGQKPEFLRTHPHDNSRILALERYMPVALKYYRPLRNKSSQRNSNSQTTKAGTKP